MLKRNLIPINYNTPEWAYLLGYLWGDGHISKTRPVTVLGIVQTDYDTIAPIVASLSNNTARVYYPQKRKATWAQSVAIHFCSRDFHTQLTALGYQLKPDQSHVLKRLSPAVHPLFWRGYFDADGTLRTKPHGSEVSICSGYDESWTSVVQMLKQIGASKWRIHQEVTPKGHRCSKIHVERQIDIVLLLQYLYSDRLDLGLTRKQLKANEICASIRESALTSICLRAQKSVNKYRSLITLNGKRQYISGNTTQDLHLNAWALHKKHNTAPFQLLNALGVGENDIIVYTSTGQSD